MRVIKIRPKFWLASLKGRDHSGDECVYFTIHNFTVTILRANYCFLRVCVATRHFSRRAQTRVIKKLLVMKLCGDLMKFSRATLWISLFANLHRVSEGFMCMFFMLCYNILPHLNARFSSSNFPGSGNDVEDLPEVTSDSYNYATSHIA
jgi:hypothetical protein